ncbi:DUF58 domain-containing protein [Fimbriiglobus ruber]|uniref:VWFA domain-containing protein n=1 Tax=Fimbriiglobus ruber TaxID=1908690 RepID=A0A225DJU3_9BACT|nr:DUF58 domain-containing protein [Fimbriiglobus ruber]OWK37459.1 hypothetical protein FRUB_06579 [Fimbriiglobus ruber]
MLPAEVMRQVRRLQLRARRAVRTLLGGEYRSAFKGAGLSFEEVREYQPGDEVRSIDWNVTARMGHPFVKRYAEERELTLVLMVDLSASQRFGTGSVTKRTAAAELAAVLAFAAVTHNDRVGLLGFTDRVERYVPPGKGPRHALRVLRDVLFFEPTRKGTDLAAALDYLNRVHRRRAIVFLFSDFLGDNFTDSFNRAARRHDLIAVRTTDPREQDWPAAGLVRLEDAETGRQVVIDAGSRSFRDAFAARARDRRATFTRLARAAQVDLIDVDTGGNHFDALLRFFRLRDRRRRGT